jgi:membrane-bound lytic murein transglycosylase B
MYIIMKSIIIALSLLLLLPANAALRGDFSQSVKAKAFIRKMVKDHQFSQDYLERLFSQAKFRADILKKYRTPKKAGVAEAGSWDRYQRIMFTNKRLNNGAAFYQKYYSQLKRAQQQYGVPAHVIAAIIGIETLYGAHTGKDRVIDALSTIAFHHPPRARYFTSELENFLLLCREQQHNPLALKGSYAGATGLSQFMPSSIRQYAVDFDGNGTTDLMNPIDAIGSVGNYLREKGWRSHEKSAFRARVVGTDYKHLKHGQKTNYSLKKLKRYGVTPVAKVNSSRKSLIVLDGKAGDEVWIGGHNLYVITRYNNSDKYAMTALLLAHRIKARAGK